MNDFDTLQNIRKQGNYPGRPWNQRLVKDILEATPGNEMADMMSYSVNPYYFTLNDIEYVLTHKKVGYKDRNSKVDLRPVKYLIEYDGGVYREWKSEEELLSNPTARERLKRYLQYGNESPWY